MSDDEEVEAEPRNTARLNITNFSEKPFSLQYTECCTDLSSQFTILLICGITLRLSWTQRSTLRYWSSR